MSDTVARLIEAFRNNGILSKVTMCHGQFCTDGWNREHVWPKSYGIGTSGDDYTDVHNLRACDWSVNSARGNLFFGECDPSLDSSCSSPAHSEAASDTAANSVLWMPPAAVRGDIARTLFYMEVRGDCYFVHLVAKVTPCCLTLA